MRTKPWFTAGFSESGRGRDHEEMEKGLQRQREWLVTEAKGVKGLEGFLGVRDLKYVTFTVREPCDCQARLRYAVLATPQTPRHSTEFVFPSH